MGFQYHAKTSCTLLINGNLKHEKSVRILGQPQWHGKPSESRYLPRQLPERCLNIASRQGLNKNTSSKTLYPESELHSPHWKRKKTHHYSILSFLCFADVWGGKREDGKEGGEREEREGQGEGQGEEKRRKSNAVWCYLLSVDTQEPLVKEKYYQKVPNISSNNVLPDIWTQRNKLWLKSAAQARFVYPTCIYTIFLNRKK